MHKILFLNPTILVVLLNMLFHCNIFIFGFSPDTNDYDAYGIKVAANDAFLVQANGNGRTFLIQYAPYNYTFDSLQCSIYYDDPTHYMYAVGVGVKQNSTTNPYFYFAGEVAPDFGSDTDYSGRNGTFIGVWVNHDPRTPQQYIRMRLPFSCDHFQDEQIEFLPSYEHQEYFVIAVEPYGQYAIGIATDFIFNYRPYPNSLITVKPSNEVWPNNATFYPCAADSSETFTIVAGFVENTARARVRANPTVYLISNGNLTVLSAWSYVPSNTSWQAHLTYSNIQSYNSKYTMSVKINPLDSNRVLIGMPFINAMFLFTIGSNGRDLTLVDSIENGPVVGYGKSVTWLSKSQAAVLANTYTLDYITWLGSKIYLYTSFNGTTIPPSPSIAIPNAQQPVPTTINTNFIRMVSTPSSLVVLDGVGGVLLILSTSPGFYPSTDTNKSPLAGAMPVVSFAMKCMAGAYKADVGVHPCTLCPTGTRNPGVLAATSCTLCSEDSFCPIGSVYEMNRSSLDSVSQAYAYPRTPDVDVFEDILLNNMFSIGSTPHCILISPMFWTLILLAIAAVFVVSTTSITWCLRQPKREKVRNVIKSVFQRTDLVGEGELWIGGLASIIILCITAMAYGFAISFLYQYPIEKVGPSTFACDSTLRNAKFQTRLQALSVPISNIEKTIFSYLDEQKFTLRVDFINTLTPCERLFAFESIESAEIPLRRASCSNVNGTLTTTVVLPQHYSTIVVRLAEIDMVGALRIGVSGEGVQNGSNTLKELNFIQSFYSESSRTLSQKATIHLELTKVINETEPLFDSNSEFEGLWYPKFTYSYDEMFTSAENYVMNTGLTSSVYTIDISETSYYIKNTQSPIAKQPEIIFRTLLFSFLCLEICAMAFLITKLIFIPACRMVSERIFRRNKSKL